MKFVVLFGTTKILLIKSPGSQTVCTIASFWSSSATWWSMTSASRGVKGIRGAWNDLSISEFRSIWQPEMVSKTKGSLVIFNYCLLKNWVQPATGRYGQGRGVRVIAWEAGILMRGKWEGRPRLWGGKDVKQEVWWLVEGGGLLLLWSPFLSPALGGVAGGRGSPQSHWVRHKAGNISGGRVDSPGCIV